MDEQTIPRRDAVGGLSLLGALIVTFIGTIVYRIVDSAPAGPPRPRASTLMAGSSGRDIGTTDETDSQSVATAGVRETVVPTVEGSIDQLRDEEVRAASHEIPDNSPRNQSKVLSDAPLFIPPGTR